MPGSERRGVLFVDVAPDAEALIPEHLRARAERISNTVPEAIRHDPVARWALWRGSATGCGRRRSS